jgi:hypothetical protein
MGAASMQMQRADGGAVTVSRRVPMTDDQIRRVHDRQMYAMKLSGSTTREIAKFFSFRPRSVNACIRAIPPAEKRRIAEDFRGQVA